MNSTDRVLGTLGAIGTFIENFPNSILDMAHGKSYTSIFDFMIDVLVACGINVNQITEYLLREIYGLEASIDNGFENFYRQLANGQIQIDEQNEFLEGLEYSIKVILMGLLSSIFTCSAIPVLPNKVFDGPDSKIFGDRVNHTLMTLLQNNRFMPFLIPKSVIDPMGLLTIGPTTSDGRLFYAVEGGDKYYHKEYVPHTIYVTELQTIPAGSSGLEVTYVEEPIYTNQVSIYLTATTFGDAYSEDTNKVVISNPLNEDINISIFYSPYASNNVLEWDSKIYAGETETRDEWLISPTDMYGKGQKSIIHSILINNETGGVAVGGDTWVYLDKEASSSFNSRWIKAGATSIDNSIIWGSENNDTHSVRHEEVITTTTEEKIEVQREEVEMVWEYVAIESSELDNNTAAERVNYLPVGDDISSTSPEYIVCYEGLNPNTLYRTMDMNAFLWYVLNKGMKNPQEEYNHMMWDNRITAAKGGISRTTDEAWNEWYASKSEYTGEFLYDGGRIEENSPFYPIIQLEPQGTAKNFFRVHLPSQRYFMPNYRRDIINDREGSQLTFNATIYKFDWDYLTNIQILHPKLLIIGLCEYLLGFSLSTISSTDISLTKKMIQAKLSSSIKDVVEAADMEVSDCYTTFSNDEFNEMLNEMLLSRYSATYYGGETSTVRQHDINEYLGMIDSINTATTTEGTITQITRLVTQVTSDPGSEGSIEYGIQVSTDGNLLQKLLWAIAMPIMQAIFTPQVMLIIVMNFELMGITKIEDFLNNDYGAILNLLLNKILSLAKSVVLFIKDKIVELLLRLFYETVMPLLIQYEITLVLEALTYWLAILQAAIACLPTFKLQRTQIIGSIDDVNYADIVDSSEQMALPESTSC